MKKNLLIAATLLSAFSAAAQDAPVAEWANLLDGTTSAGDQVSKVACNANGVYWLATMGSTEENNSISYAGEPLFHGEDYNAGTSQTNNLCLLATDHSGAKKWFICSNSGDYASNKGNVAVDGEGNVIFTAKVRHGAGDGMSKQINMIDAAGNVISYGGTTERRNYALLVVKADAQGKILWYKYITLDTTPSPSATKDFIADAVNSTALTVDPQGNIYVGGCYSAEMTVEPDVVLPARNIAHWNGDSQLASGDMFLLKYDSDGKLLSTAIGNDGLTRSQIIGLSWEKGSLYFLGTAQGDSNLEFAGKNTAISSQQTPVFGMLNADLSAQWVSHLDAEGVSGGSAVIQNAGMTVAGNTLWIAGQFNGKYTDPTNAAQSIASATKSTREGCVIKLNAADGSWIAGTTSRSDDFTPTAAKTGITGYFKVLQNVQKPEKIYVYGYVMNASVGVILREYDAETLAANVDNSWSLVKKGGVPSATAIAYYPESNVAYISARGNQAFDAIGGMTTSAPVKWGNLLAAVKMPAALFSAVDNIAIDAVEEDAPVEYYNLQGVRLNADNLPAGIYIRRQGSRTEKILVR